MLANMDVEENDINKTWCSHKETFLKAGEVTIGFRRGTKKERWISDETWKAVDERKLIKIKKEQLLSSATVTDNLEHIMEQYKSKDKEVKRRCKEDKEKWIEANLQEAESAAGRGDMKTLYKIVKDLSGRSSTQMVPVKKLDGNTASTHEEQHSRWRQHFESVLNCPEPEIQHDFTDNVITPLDIDTNDIPPAKCIEQYPL